MKLRVIVHQTEGGGNWAEVSFIQGCATQGETFKEFLVNIYEAMEAYLSIKVKDIEITKNDKVL